jgi:hypothetical protein
MSPAIDASAVADQTGTWLLAALFVFIALVLLFVIAVQLLGPDPIPSSEFAPTQVPSEQWLPIDEDTAAMAAGRGHARPYVTGRHAARSAR